MHDWNEDCVLSWVEQVSMLDEKEQENRLTVRKVSQWIGWLWKKSFTINRWECELNCQENDYHRLIIFASISEI